LGIPWLVAFALRADGWYLRSDIIWHKPNPVPESAKDRCTRAHEYVFLLTKSKRYFYDAKALEEKAKYGKHNEKYQGTYARHKIEAMQVQNATNSGSQYNEGLRRPATNPHVRNARSVWAVATRSYSGAHFATMPPELARRCVLAGSSVGSLVIDPFAGAGTTLLVAQQEGREWAGCDINSEYVSIAGQRLMEEMLGGVL
jgi:DNA modification methylase